VIGVDGEYLLKFDVGDEKDFLNRDDFETLTLVEEVGNVLPTFEIGFTTRNDKIMGLLNETNDIELSFGRSNKDLLDTKLYTARFVATPGGHAKRSISANGFYSAIDYITPSNVFLSDEKSGVEVIKEITAKHFPHFESNIDVSEDKQIWIQPNFTDRKFVNDLWMHSHLPDSFPAVGIASDGTFILKDILKDIKDAGKDPVRNKAYAWKFTVNPEDDEKEILIDPDPVIQSNSGFINNLVGYTKERAVYDIESGLTEIIRGENKTLLALASKIAKRSEMGNHFLGINTRNENLHENYWNAFYNNLTRLISFGALKVTTSFQGVFKPVKILDLVMFKDPGLGNTTASSEFATGLYYVTKVARTTQKNQVATVVEMCRESLNEVRGQHI